MVVLVSKKKDFVYLVQSVSTEKTVNSVIAEYFASLSVSFESVNDFVKENKFACSVLLALFIVSSFLLRGF